MPTGSAQVVIAAGPSGRHVAGLSPSAPAVRAIVPVDYQTTPLVSPPVAAGQTTAQVKLPAAPVGMAMRIERIAVTTSGNGATGGSSVSVYAGDPTHPENLVDFSGAPGGDNSIADENQPILVPGGVDLFVVWSNMAVGATGYARVQWELVQFVRGQLAGPASS